MTARGRDLVEEYFSGKKLYGDDIDLRSMQEWYAAEEHGYSELVDKGNYRYAYHALDEYHAFRHLRNGTHTILGIGSSYGHEFIPLITKQRVKSITIIEPGDAFHQETIHGMPCRYIKPSRDGTLPFADGSFDLITCFSALHHIPNVSYVSSELYRCLEPGGTAMIREPIISMGDWRKARKGLTRHERGIPLGYFDDTIARIGFTVIQRSICCFPPLEKIWAACFKASAYNSRFAVRLDAMASSLFQWNYRYHRTNMLRKFAPTSVIYVLGKEQ
jgi:SAM-dependent methyltransferase